jgi:hypothetical protein
VCHFRDELSIVQSNYSIEFEKLYSDRLLVPVCLVMHASLACYFLRFHSAVLPNKVHATKTTSIHALNITFEYAVEINPASKLQLTPQRADTMQAGQSAPECVFDPLPHCLEGRMRKTRGHALLRTAAAPIAT